ncbi:MAG TPA: beta-galactosidase [Ktedonobacteraceae bacterium]|nr:beta-galactosidase [Ktedonobacteraceae bacterium]
MQKTEKASRKALRIIAPGVGAASLLMVPLALEVRLKRATQPLTDAWQYLPVEPRRSTLLGISFRLPQVAMLGLDARTTLQTLLTYPFQLIRLGAYWNRMEPEPGIFHTDELDWQVDAAERAGMQIILCVGPLKTFSYPEFFVPAHHLRPPFQEHTLIKPSAYPALLAAATEFITRVVERYKQRKGIVAWQLEHEAVDPLGVEHSWRLDVAFVEKEVEALRKADPTRPIMMNGFLPASLPVRLSQWWRTRDQGDSLAVAQRVADIVGIDYYPRHALMPVGAKTLYLDGSGRGRFIAPWQQGRQKQLFAWARAHGQKLMIAEGQAEPWETVTTPPNPDKQGMYSCLPEQVITNYNTCMSWSRQEASLYAYLFWGAEYWMLRKQCADSSYLQAFARILEHA